jgi:hypothetical protein
MSTHDDRNVRLSRDSQVRALEQGSSISISDRIDTTFGVDSEAISARTRQLRGIMDQSAHRARQQVPNSEFVVENGSFVTKAGAILLTAVVTRTA